jgi:tetratricopeptide (TPR) repeat protein
MAGNAGDYSAVRSQADEARAISMEAGDANGIATADFFLGGAEVERRDYERACDLFQESAQLFHELGDELSELEARSLHARTLTELGDFEQAQELIAEILQRARELGDATLEFAPLMGNAAIALEQERADDALALMKESLRIARDTGQLLRARIALGGIARVLSVMGYPEPGARLLACTDALSREITGNFSWLSARRKDETLASLREQLPEDAFAAAWAEGSTMTLDEGVELALSVD